MISQASATQVSGYELFCGEAPPRLAKAVPYLVTRRTELVRGLEPHLRARPTAVKWYSRGLSQLGAGGVSAGGAVASGAVQSTIYDGYCGRQRGYTESVSNVGQSVLKKKSQ